MKILISGATGLVGNILIQEALLKGNQIHFLTRNKSKLGSHDGVTAFYWNPSKNEIDTACFEGVDSIIHLAGATVSKRWTKKYKEEILSSRIQSTSLLVESLKNKEHQIKTVVSASAIGVYPSSINKIHSEEDVVESDSFIGQVVVKWEREVDRFSKLNLKVSKLRIGLVLSSNGGVLTTLKIPTQFGLGAAFASGKQWQSWIHISDLSRLFITAASGHWEGIYNATAPEVVSQTEFMRQLADSINRPFFMPPLPKFLIKLIVGEMSTLVLISHYISSQKVTDTGFEYEFPSLKTALEDLF